MKSHTALAMLLSAVAACGEVPTTPALIETSGPALSAHRVSPITLTLRPETSEVNAWGELLVMVGQLVPPNPCHTTLQAATVIVCGVIHNPEGTPITSGSLRIVGGDSRVVELEFAVPPSPCRTYIVRAAGAPELGTRTGLPAVQAEFNTALGKIVSVQVAPGPPDNPGRGGSAGEDSPFLPPSPCLVEFAPDVRDR